MSVHFVVVNYHGAAALPGYLESLRGQDDPAWRMSVVDNTGDPAEADRLARAAGDDTRVRVCPAPGNLGYFGGAHWLLSRPGVEPADWTVVSNMDVRLAGPGFVRRLRGMDGGAPVLAPMVLGARDGRPQNPYLVDRPTVGAMRRLRLVFAHPVPAQAYGLAAWAGTRLVAWARHRGPVPAEPRRRPVYAPHGSIIALHRRYFAAGGSLEHPVFLFNEEITLAERCRRLGLTVMFEPALLVIHDKHQATGVWRSRRVLRAQCEAAAYGYQLIRSDR